MPLQTKKIIKKFDYNPKNKTVSIAYDKVAVDDDGTEYLKDKNHRCGFVPGDLEKVKEYIGQGVHPEWIALLDSYWTEDVIFEHHDQIAKAEADVGDLPVEDWTKEQLEKYNNSIPKKHRIEL